MVLTVTGIAGPSWSAGPRRRRSGRQPGASVSGVFFGFCGALGQAGGLVLSKLGMGGYDAVAATQVRVLRDRRLRRAVFHLPLVAAGGPALRDAGRCPSSPWGAFFGPCVGGSSRSTPSTDGVGSGTRAHGALTPIILIPLVVLLRRERGRASGAWPAPPWRFAGVALLFL